MFSKINIIFSLLIFAGCSNFELSSLNQAQVKILLETPAFKAFGIGLGLADNKKNFFMGLDNYYFDALDSIGISKEIDSIYYYEYLSKFFDGVKVTLNNITLVLKANEKELKALASYSKGNIISIKDFIGDDELFNEDISNYSLLLDYTILIEGYTKSQRKYAPIMKENQSYFIYCKDNNVISATFIYN